MDGNRWALYVIIFCAGLIIGGFSYMGYSAGHIDQLEASLARSQELATELAEQSERAAGIVAGAVRDVDGIGEGIDEAIRLVGILETAIVQLRSVYTID